MGVNMPKTFGPTSSRIREMHDTSARPAVLILPPVAADVRRLTSLDFRKPHPRRSGPPYVGCYQGGVLAIMSRIAGARDLAHALDRWSSYLSFLSMSGLPRPAILFVDRTQSKAAAA